MIGRLIGRLIGKFEFVSFLIFENTIYAEEGL